MINVEKILPPDLSLKAPDCIAGAIACPPKDRGSTPGYEEFLEAIAEPKREDHNEMLTSYGGSFDPTAFDLNTINARLSQIKL